VGLDQVDAHILPGDQVKQLAAHRPLQVLHYRSQRQNLEWGKKKKNLSTRPHPLLSGGFFRLCRKRRRRRECVEHARVPSALGESVWCVQRRNEE
jgi:hypothetical protein